MKLIKLFSLLLLSLIAYSASAEITANEKLTYNVKYKWGLVNKQAGRATFTLSKTSNGNIKAIMSARTEPWADHIYSVRDTLISTFNPHTCLPAEYQRIAHEGKQYANDHVTFTKNNSSEAAASCVRLRKKKANAPIDKSQTSLTARGEAVDLLSAFYYLRNLNFDKINKGYSKTINIFSGKRKEILKITFNGIEDIKIDKQKYSTFFVTFTFTSDSGKTTSKPIKAWLTTDKRHIPLKLVGELPIGRVECYYSGKI